MIKYSLICNKCDLTFESWFASSNEFEKLKKRKFLNCHNCGSLDVKKSLMAPSLINNKKNQNYEKDTKKLNKIKKTLKEYQKFIKNNFEYVGDNFAYEARSIHYNNKKKEKGIYGTASKKDLEDLREEGIETKMIPWIEDDKN
tara:strand:+ start:420 stop:848 length:429 start_codon:yes stop_codon:yes gene_type:complete